MLTEESVEEKVNIEKRREERRFSPWNVNRRYDDSSQDDELHKAEDSSLKNNVGFPEKHPWQIREESA